MVHGPRHAARPNKVSDESYTYDVIFAEEMDIDYRKAAINGALARGADYIEPPIHHYQTVGLWYYRPHYIIQSVGISRASAGSVALLHYQFSRPRTVDFSPQLRTK